MKNILYAILIILIMIQFNWMMINLIITVMKK